MKFQTYLFLSRRVFAVLAETPGLDVAAVAERAGLTNKCTRDVLRAAREVGAATSTKNAAGINQWFLVGLLEASQP
ncbi:hypothetical protein ACFFX1_08185 [Dactylosporangium sucinum]|uniref:Uncharacterized protein n=1 Tax=Dactylosporangium sucinum TaxID=1424081 RepID=A0A917U4X6_9ACTN|nr:hypothetical protein [Dactylosporangium sucinum]GGM55520.1 hypothetical protein GCM10007977_066510 [Dactylosporangium sucinum]